MEHRYGGAKDNERGAYRIFQSGSDMMPGWALVRYVFVGLMLLRIGVEVRNIHLGRSEWTRLIVPLLIAIATLLIGNHVISPKSAFVAFAFLEVTFVFFCISLARAMARNSQYAPEHVVRLTLERFFPAHFAAMIGSEMTIMKHAWRGLRGSVFPPPVSPLTYVQSNRFGVLTLLLAVSLLPDAIVTHLLIPSHYWMIAVGLDLLCVYSLVWVAGIFGTMLDRPHVICGETVTIHRGMLAQTQFQVADILSACVTDKTIDGVTALKIQLRKPVELNRLFRGKTQTSLVLIQSDLPHQLLGTFNAQRSQRATCVKECNGTA